MAAVAEKPQNKDASSRGPAGPATAPAPVSPAKSEDFLLEHGWKKDGHLWADPAGKREPGKLVEYGRIKNKDKADTIIEQLTVPPVPWSYRLQDAVRLQRERLGLPPEE